MLFNSFEYLLFLPLVLGLHYALPQRWRWLLLLVASYAFYMSWNPVYLILIVSSTLVDFVVSSWLPRASAARKPWPPKIRISASRCESARLASPSDCPVHDPALYADPAHLNARGARLFSELLADEIARLKLWQR